VANDPTKYVHRVVELAVGPEGCDLCDAAVTRVRIEDEAAGEFVVVTQQRDDNSNQNIAIAHDEWPAIMDAIDRMVKACRKDEA
jgi:hypothetical protein